MLVNERLRQDRRPPVQDYEKINAAFVNNRAYLRTEQVTSYCLCYARGNIYKNF